MGKMGFLTKLYKDAEKDRRKVPLELSLKVNYLTKIYNVLIVFELVSCCIWLGVTFQLAVLGNLASSLSLPSYVAIPFFVSTLSVMITCICAVVVEAEMVDIKRKVVSEYVTMLQNIAEDKTP